MKAGDIVFDADFVHDDGTSGPKLIVLLTDDRGDPVLVVKTTSQSERYSRTPGPALEHRFPAFHLPVGSCSFAKPTWVDLGQVFAFAPADLSAGLASGRLRVVDTLPAPLFVELLEATMAARDTTGRHRAILQRGLSLLA